MNWLPFFLTFLSAFSAPLQPDSLVSLRTTVSQPSAGGNSILYKELILEEWNSNPVLLLQTWTPNCTLPDIQTESLREGLLRSRFPYGDGVWFLCRNVPVNTTFSTQIAPLVIMNLQENGEMIQYATDTNAYPGGTTTNLVLPYWDIINNRNVFYILGGAVQASIGTPPRPSQPRIRIDSGSGTPPEIQGVLATYPAGVNPVSLSIMTDSLFMPALVPNGTSIAFFAVYLVGQDNNLPTGTRNSVSFALPTAPQMLSSWTFPSIDTLWYTAINRLPYLARTNFTESDPTKQTLVFTLPGGGPSGTLGGITWRINTARFEGEYFTTGETVYISNGSSIVKNTVLGLTTGVSYQLVATAPTGWRFMDVHARSVNLPSPTPTPTATATMTSSMTPIATETSSMTPTSTATTSATMSSTITPTTTATMSSTPTTTQTSSSSSSASHSADPPVTLSPSPTISVSPSPSNGTIPNPANIPTSKVLTPGEEAGISIGAIAAVVITGIALIKYTPSLQKLYIRQFGSKMGNRPAKTFKAPIRLSKDVPITISHNPHILVQQRIEQLKQFNKQRLNKDPLETIRGNVNERHKKEFLPTISGASV